MKIMYHPERTGNGRFTLNGVQVGYLEDWTLYAYGKRIGEFDNMPEIYNAIEKEIENAQNRMDDSNR